MADDQTLKSESEWKNRNSSTSDGSSDTKKVLDARLVSWENIPTWTNHTWPRVSREVVTKLPTPPPAILEPVRPSALDSSSSSNESSDSESDEDIEDPLSQVPGSKPEKEARFPINPVINDRISLWYVFDPRKMLEIETVIIYAMEKVE